MERSLSAGCAPHAPFASYSDSTLLFNLEVKVDKSETHETKQMTREVVGNYLRVHRRRLGLSQRELGVLVGYGHRYAVGRHERSKAEPPLLIALAYEIVFQVPASKLFTGFHSAVNESVVQNMQGLKASLESTGNGRHRSRATLQKLQWLSSQLNN